MLSVFVFPLCLLLPNVGGSGFPDFGDDYDYYGERYVCEGDACARSNIYLQFDKTIQVPNQTVTYEEYESFYVNTVGLLADCAPSLSVGDIASSMKSCKENHWKYTDACKYRKKGWLDKDGQTVNESLGTNFKEIEGVLGNIMKCLDWDGVDYYDYDYHYGYYDYDLDYYDINDMVESDNVQVRAKREQKSNEPEFMIQKARLKRNIDKKENKHVKKRGNMKGKNKGKHGRKSGKKGKKSGKKGKKHGQRRKKSARERKKGGKGRRNSGKRKYRGAKKAYERKKHGKNKKKKGNNKKNENKKKKEERKKKEKERKLLEELGYDSMPNEETQNKLDCVERAIQYGLEKCGVRIFKKLDNP